MDMAATKRAKRVVDVEVQQPILVPGLGRVAPERLQVEPRIQAALNKRGARKHATVEQKTAS